MDLQKNKVYRCQITDYTADGTGFAKIEGRAVFVPRTAVGDQCDVRIVKVTKNVAFGRVEKIVVPSAQRTAPACPVADKCGGCCYQHITYGEELRAKEKKVRDALTRIGGQDGAKLLGITGAPTTEHYRNKAQYPVGRDKEGSIVTGFYRPRSHDIVPVEKCLIQSETADKIAAVVREWMTEFSVMPYDYEKKRGTIRHIYVRMGEKSGESQLTLISATKKMPKLDVLVERLRAAAPSLTGILLNHNQRDDNVILGNRTDVLWGEPMLEDRLCGHTFLLSPEAFYQVNHAQAERLYACAVDYAGLTGEETVLDLYCGAGTITLALAEHAKTAIGVEIVPEAIENAKRNALRKVRFDKIDREAFVHIVQLLLHDIRSCRAELLSCPQIRRGLFVVQLVPPNLFSDAVECSLGRCQLRESFDDFFRIVVRKYVDLQTETPQSLRRAFVQRQHFILCVTVVVHVLVRYRVIGQKWSFFRFIQGVCFAGKRSLV